MSTEMGQRFVVLRDSGLSSGYHPNFDTAVGFRGQAMRDALYAPEMSDDLRPTPVTEIGRVWQEGMLFDHIPDAIVLVGEGGRIQGVNSQCTAMFGYDKGELLAQPIEILMPERFRRGHLRHRTAYNANPRARAMGERREL